MKRIICCLLALLLTACAAPYDPYALPASEISGTRSVLIVMYHSVLKDPDRAGKYIISPDTLESDIRCLTDAGFTFVSLHELIDYVDGRARLPEKPAVLTFDDGYYNNLTYVLPILTQYDCCAAISVVGEYAQRFTDTPDPNPNYGHLSFDELAAMVLSDRIELVNHSYAMHAQTARKGSGRKSGESADEYAAAFTADTLRCQERIAAYTGTAPTAYAYPYGVIGEGSRELLANMGFRITLTCCEQIPTLVQGNASSLFGLGRFNRPSGVTSAAFFEPIFQKWPE